MALNNYCLAKCRIWDVAIFTWSCQESFDTHDVLGSTQENVVIKICLSECHYISGRKIWEYIRLFFSIYSLTLIFVAGYQHVVMGTLLSNDLVSNVKTLIEPQMSSVAKVNDHSNCFVTMGHNTGCPCVIFIVSSCREPN